MNAAQVTTWLDCSARRYFHYPMGLTEPKAGTHHPKAGLPAPNSMQNLMPINAK